MTMTELIDKYEKAFQEFHIATIQLAEAVEREEKARYAKEDATTKVNAKIQTLLAQRRLHVMKEVT